MNILNILLFGGKGKKIIYSSSTRQQTNCLIIIKDFFFEEKSSLKIKPKFQKTLHDYPKFNKHVKELS